MERWQFTIGIYIGPFRCKWFLHYIMMIIYTTEHQFWNWVHRDFPIQQRYLSWFRVWVLDGARQAKHWPTQQRIHPLPQPPCLLTCFYQALHLHVLQVTQLWVRHSACLHCFQIKSCPNPKGHIPWQRQRQESLLRHLKKGNQKKK